MGECLWAPGSKNVSCFQGWIGVWDKATRGGQLDDYQKERCFTTAGGACRWHQGIQSGRVLQFRNLLKKLNKTYYIEC